MKHGGCTYMVTNKNDTVIFIGVSSALRARIEQHKTKYHPKSFTARYNCDKIVWYKSFPRIEAAIDREKQLKAGNRKKKEELINKMNPEWKDLGDQIQDL